MTEKKPAVDLDAFMRDVQNGPYREGMQDDQRRRARLYQQMRDSNDPTWSEIGRKLYSGQMSLRDLAKDRTFQEATRDVSKNVPTLRKHITAAAAHMAAKAQPPADK